MGSLITIILFFYIAHYLYVANKMAQNLASEIKFKGSSLKLWNQIQFGLVSNAAIDGCENSDSYTKLKSKITQFYIVTISSIFCIFFMDIIGLWDKYT